MRRSDLVGLRGGCYSGDLCDECGNTIRFKKDDRCVSCNQYKRPKDTAKGKAEFTRLRRRVEDLQKDYYESLIE